MKLFWGTLASIFLIPILIFLTACQTAQRSPSNIWSLSEAFEQAYKADLDYQLLLEKKKNAEKLAEYQTSRDFSDSSVSNFSKKPNELAALEDELNKKEAAKKYYLENLQSGLNSSLGAEIEPFSILTNSRSPWRKQKERLLLSNLEPYLKKQGPVLQKYFTMNFHNVKDYELWIDNRYFSQAKKNFNQSSYDSTHSQPYLEAELTCNGSFRIKRSLFTDVSKGGEKVKFRVYDSDLNAERIYFYPSLNITQCQLTFFDPDFPKRQYSLNLYPEHLVFKNKSQYQGLAEGCVLPFFEDLGPTETFFLTSDFNSMTCPLKAENVRTLEDSDDGFQEKVKILLGQPLNKEFFSKKNPFLKLDFSKAPVLDEILISYLVYRSDFYGTIMTRLLEYHASKGALIRILVSDSIQLKKDRIMLFDLAAKYNNVKIQEYRWMAPDWAGLSDRFSQLHKSMHVKMFITLSSKQPEKNVAVIGGRNIHDGFLFKQTPNYRSFPSLIQYPKEESFVHWKDFEVRIQDQKFVWQSAAHFMTLWELDSETFFQRSINFNLSQPQKLVANYFETDKPIVRHLMSIPFKDEMALEKFYIQMFDSAQKSIRISTPYLHLSKGLSESLTRASSRGVKVSIITRLDLKGDTIDFVVSDVNKKAVNQFIDRFDIFEYVEPKVILHSKIALIDDTLSFVGSVNLNRRSFLHDLENGLLIYGKGYNSQMGKILSDYQRKSKKIDSKQKVRWINKLILTVPAFRDAL